MMKNGDHVFNPGWDSNARSLGVFMDVRDVQRQFKERGVEFIGGADERPIGPASWMLADPDGNTILIDQHV
jgi:hypothetical protein